MTNPTTTDPTTTVDTAATREVAARIATIDSGTVEHFGPCWVTHDGHRATTATHRVITEELPTPRRLCRDCAIDEVAYCAEFGVHYRIERLVAYPIVPALAPRPSGTTWVDSETGDPVVWVPDTPTGRAVWYVDNRCDAHQQTPPAATTAHTATPARTVQPATRRRRGHTRIPAPDAEKARA